MPSKGVFMWHGKCGSIHFTRIDFKFDSFTLWLLLFTVRFRNKLKICFFSSSWCCNKWWCIKIVLFLFQVAKTKPALIDKSVEKVRKTRFWYTFEYYFCFLYKPSHIFSVCGGAQSETSFILQNYRWMINTNCIDACTHRLVNTAVYVMRDVSALIFIAFHSINFRFKSFDLCRLF